MKSIQEQTGKTLSLTEDFADIYRLHVLGEEIVSSGALEDVTLVLDAPIICGSLRLYRLTMGGMIWLDQFREWYDDDPSLIGYGLIYALANGRTEEFYEPGSKKEIKKRVLKWSKSVRDVSFDSIERCLDCIMPKDSATPQDSGRGGYGPMLSMLMAEIGHPASYWVNEISMELASEILQELFKMKFQEVSDGKTPNPFDPYIVASKEFYYFKKDMLKRYAKED